jgi:hypothetical protein
MRFLFFPERAFAPKNYLNPPIDAPRRDTSSDVIFIAIALRIKKSIFRILESICHFAISTGVWPRF